MLLQDIARYWWGSNGQNVDDFVHVIYIWNVTLHTCLFKIDISRPIALDGTLMMAAVLAFCKPFPIDYINKISEAETKRVPNRYTSSALCNHPMQHTHVTLSRSYWRWPEMYMSRGIRRKRSQTASSGTARGIIWISYRYHHIRLSYWSILVYYHVWFRIFGWRPGSSLPMTVQAWGPDRELESHKAQTLKRTFEHMVEWCQVCARSVCVFMIIPIFYHIHMVSSSSRVWSCCWTVECRFRMI